MEWLFRGSFTDSPEQKELVKQLGPEPERRTEIRKAREVPKRGEATGLTLLERFLVRCSSSYASS